MSRDPLRLCVSAVVTANRQIVQAADQTRSAWGEESRAAFDRAHLDDLMARARNLASEMESIAEVARNIELALEKFRSP